MVLYKKNSDIAKKNPVFIKTVTFWTFSINSTPLTTTSIYEFAKNLHPHILRATGNTAKNENWTKYT